ncbi:MAG: T9SS type A sorting domain-containing protein [Flavipsychrobacter sp.]|nr:T9SS type A sorting domain-containing protein [Flavipsychrobacter sp.]
MKLNFKSVKKVLSGLAYCGVFGGLAIAPGIVNAQTASPYGFENGSVSAWAGYSGTESVSLNTNAIYTRTGVNSIKLTTTSTSSNKQWYGTSPSDSSFNNETIFFIYWAKADAAASSDASFRYSSSFPISGSGSSSNASGGVALSTTTWTRVTNSISSSSTRYYFSAPRKTTSGAANIYLDDGILYTSLASNPTVDTIKPATPSAVTGTVSGNLVSLGWTSNVDNSNGTGVQATIILRNSNTSASAPVLNDQAQYSVTGGAAGPDSVAGGWKIISTTGGATDVSYLDATPAPGGYIYAVVLRDLAYNYSVAAVSGVITAAVAVPTIFVNQAGFNGSFGTVVTGRTSALQQYNVSAYNLTSNLVVTAPAGFLVSTTPAPGGFNATANLAPVSGTIAVTPIYVEYAPTAPSGATGTLNITNASTGAATINVPVSGSALDTLPTTAGTLTFGTVMATSVVVNLPTIGNGSNRIIAVSQGGSVSYVPVNGAAVAGVNANFTLATDQGSGNKVVYDGTGSGNNVVTVTGLTPQTLYSFAVFEYNKGTGATSQAYLPVSPVTALVKTDSVNLAVGNIINAADIKVYPNPAHGAVHMQSPAAVNISLCDVTGRVIYTQKNVSIAGVEHLANGLYILTITNNGGELLKREKIVVQ